MSKKTEQILAKDFKAVRMKRLKGFKDGYHITFEQGALRCPLCKTPMFLNYIIVSSWPYIHGDYCLNCLRCGFKALFGVPEDPVVGMELIIWDSKPIEVLAIAEGLERPICPFHLKKMKVTKIFGDYIRDDDQIRVQWKCSEWFLTEHLSVPRNCKK